MILYEMHERYNRPLSELLELPGSDLTWASLCSSIKNDLNNPKKRKQLTAPLQMNELTEEEQKAKFRRDFE